MPSILDEIASMEEAVLAALDAALEAADVRAVAMQQAAQEAVLAVLDGYEPDELLALDLAELAGPIEDALSGVLGAFDQDLQQLVAEGTLASIEAAQAFYDERGLDMPAIREAARRSETATQLGILFEAEMQLRNERLKRETVDAVQDWIAEGTLDRDALTDRIASRSLVTRFQARTQSQTAISAYNQAYRNELAASAQLEHFLYYGGIKDTTRPFCRAVAGKVYDAGQIEQMDNGMLNPVRVFKGGWNCRHTWVPVDPGWDDELAGLQSTATTSTTIEADGLTLTVFS